MIGGEIMYQLYINKDNYKLKVTPLQTTFRKVGSIIKFEENGSDTDILDYNSCHKMCKTRKVLVQLARDIKAEWLQEVMEQVKKIENIKI